ncbi:MAG: ARMT1-like domain-containing protein [Thermoplasmata archaeon]|nr:ARMT1-like domain-containing protein [Thermoplasmata archaeon]
MKTYPDCIVCYLRQVLEALDLNDADEDTKREVVFRATRAMEKMDFTKSPFENTGIPHSIVARVLDIEDPYAGAKVEMNRKAEEIVKKIGFSGIVQASNPLDSLLRLSAVGNWLDYGPPVNKNLDRINELLNDRKVLSARYWQNLRKLEKIISMGKLKIGFLGDNAGEIFFDRFIIAWLSDLHEITYFVKERPWINDAMLSDARIAGVDDYATIDVVPIKNWKLELRSPAFLSKLKNFDLVIAKGQGNYETLGQEKLKVFYLLITKCRLVAADLETQQGKIVLESRGY